MRLGKLTAFCLIALVATPCVAATKDDTSIDKSHLYYDKLNALGNMYQNTLNPVRLTYNKVKTIADAHLRVNFLNGNYHAIDEGKKARDLEVNIGGLMNFGRLDVYGHIDYVNSKEYDHRWNSTLFTTATNPFILGDSIASDANTETFSMSAAVSYQFSPLFTGALSLEYKTGSFSDQTDPRPKTDAMHFVINPGVEFNLTPVHKLGISAMIDIFRSDISHSIVNNYMNNTYFVMKGMGDHTVFTTNDFGGYPRDYKGCLYNGALQWMVTPSSGKVKNMLQLAFSANKELSEDGGSQYTYKSGDYYRKDISLYDRFHIQGNKRLIQNISLGINYTTDKGNWYDQKKVIDTEHNNLPYYVILNKSQISESTYLKTHLAYEADFLRNDTPDWSVNADVAFNVAEMKYYSSDVFKQSYQVAALQAGATKHLHIKKFQMKGKAQGFYTLPVGEEKFASPDSKMTRCYTAPVFEYATASNAGFHLEADFFYPFTIYRQTTWMGLKCRVTSAYYLGDSKYSSLYASRSRTNVDIAFNVRF